jgi:hypothetical protein
MERKKVSYYNRKSKTGDYVSHIPVNLASRLRNYCKLTGQNCQRYVEESVIKKLDTDERELLNTKSKEELIELIMNKNI